MLPITTGSPAIPASILRAKHQQRRTGTLQHPLGRRSAMLLRPTAGFRRETLPFPTQPAQIMAFIRRLLHHDIRIILHHLHPLQQTVRQREFFPLPLQSQHHIPRIGHAGSRFRRRRWGPHPDGPDELFLRGLLRGEEKVDRWPGLVGAGAAAEMDVPAVFGVRNDDGGVMASQGEKKFFGVLGGGGGVEDLAEGFEILRGVLQEAEIGAD